jgi:hypothetical protein
MNAQNYSQEPRNGVEKTDNGSTNERFDTTDYVDLDELPMAGLANYLREAEALGRGVNVQSKGDALEVSFRLHGMRIHFAVHFTPQPDEAIGCRGGKSLSLSARVPLRRKEGDDRYDALIHSAHEWNGWSDGPRFVFRELQSKPPAYIPLGGNFDTLVAYWDFPANVPVHVGTLKATLVEFVCSIFAACDSAFWEGLFVRRTK